jgi:hypothetical protein
VKTPCPTCKGSGIIETPDVEPCDAVIEVAPHETVRCWADRPHPDQPHMALLCEPCPECAGYDAHGPTCPVPNRPGYVAEPDPTEHWYSWRTGDGALTQEDDEQVAEWRRQFFPVES